MGTDGRTGLMDRGSDPVPDAIRSNPVHGWRLQRIHLRNDPIQRAGGVPITIHLNRVDVFHQIMS